MVIIFVSFVILIILGIGSYLISFNFYNYDFSAGINNIFQSKIVNEQNFQLFSGYKEFFNSGVSDQDMRCYSGTTYEDTNCYSRGLYGFLPPKATLDLGNFQGISGTGFNLNLTGDTSSGVNLIVRSIAGQSTGKFSSAGTGGYIPFNVSGDYNIKIKNNGSAWVQYFLTLSGSDGFDFNSQYSGGYLYISKDFTPKLGANSIFNTIENLQSIVQVKSCSEIYSLNASSLSGNYLLEPVTNPMGVTGYCEMTGAGYTWLYDTLASVSNTKLLLHFDNNILDSSLNNYTLSNNGVTFNTSNKFGGYSASFNGSSNYLSLADSNDWDVGAGDFTIDFWTNLQSVASANTFLGQWSDNTTYRGRIIYLQSGNLFFDYYDTGATRYSPAVSWTPTTSTRYHVAIVRTSNVLKFFINGNQVGSNQSITQTINNSNLNLLIGATGYGASNIQYLNGYLDELRITKGQALRTSSFTPPTMPYKY